MKRPTWATVVGIAGIVLGCFGILGAGQTVMMPKIIELQKEIFTEVQKSFENRGDTQEKVFNMFEKMWDVPDWFKTWSIAAGIAGLFVSGFYILASIFLLLLRRHAIKLFYLAVGISISLALLKAIISISAMSFIGFTIMAGGMFGIIINIILFIVVLTGDKKAFACAEPPSKKA